jgi:hypothetical protein
MPEYSKTENFIGLVDKNEKFNRKIKVPQACLSEEFIPEGRAGGTFVVTLHS